MYSFKMTRMWFWIKQDWQSASRKQKTEVYGVSERRVTLSFNFSCNFFQRHCVIVQPWKRCVIFSPKELQKEQNDVVESPKTKSFSFWYILVYCVVSYIETMLNTCFWQLFVVMYKWPSNLIHSNKTFFQNIFATWVCYCVKNL